MHGSGLELALVFLLAAVIAVPLAVGLGIASAAFNPLDRLDPAGLDLADDCMTLADALVYDAPGEAGEAHWNEEAKALIAGMILHTVVHESPARVTLASAAGRAGRHRHGALPCPAGTPRAVSAR